MKPESTDHDFSPFFRVYKDGRVQKVRRQPKSIPPSDDPLTGVKSKDVIISADPNISARLFLPPSTSSLKLPVILYIHGGGYCWDSAFSKHYHCHVSALSSGAQAIAVSVEYRLALEHPIPACYDDSWAALLWVVAHADGTGPDPWLNDHADFSRLFIGGDSGGANITHNLASRIGLTPRLPGMIRISGLFLVHPVFGGIENDDRMWMYLCPSNTGRLDPRLNPPREDLARMPCGRVLVMVAEKDYLKGTGMCYYWNLKKSGWNGTVELVECKGEGHCFHLSNQRSDKALDLVERIVLFIKQGCVDSFL